MTNKGKVENFDDLDTIDEDQWGEEGDASVVSSDSLSVDAEGNVKKKSSGGFLFGLLLIGLLGGGSWYAYQSDLIPGLNKRSAGVSENIPSPEQSTPSAVSPLAEGSTDLPPMPENPISVQGSAPGLGEAKVTDTLGTEPVGQVPVNESSSDVVAAPNVDEGGVLTPFPVSDTTESELQPLELADADALDIPSVAEKDGMLAQDPSSQILDPEVSSRGSPIEDIPVAGDGVPGLGDGGSESLEKLGEDLGTPDSLSGVNSLDEPTLSEEVDQVVSSHDSLVENQETTSSDVPIVSGQATESISTDPVEDLSSSEPKGELEPAPVSTEPPTIGNDEKVLDVEDGESASDDFEPSVQPTDADSFATVSPPSSAQPKENKVESMGLSPAVKEAQADGAGITSGEEEKKTSDVKVSQSTKDSGSSKKSILSPKKVSSALTWKLRSAKPGSAVLYDSRTGDVKAVETGDRVSGLGKIKSITKVNGKWIIKGTAGSLSQ